MENNEYTLEEKIPHMWEIVKFLEGRISMVDTKANMLIAIEVGLFLVISWITVLSQREPEHRPIFLVGTVGCTHGLVPPFGREFSEA